MRLAPAYRRFVTATGLLGLVLAAAPAALTAQDDDVPRRPKLEDGADTNNAQAYYDLGVRLLERDPRRAADAFYWVTRIAPNRADAFYARRTALLMGDRSRFDRYMAGDRRTIEHKRTRQIDSLLAHALTIDPFLYRKFERAMFRKWIVNMNSEGFAAYQPSANDIDRAIHQWILDGDAEMKGWAAYNDGDFRLALSEYGRAVKSSKRKARLRTERARIFQLTGRVDSALVEFGLALEELRDRDNREVVFVYDSKALIEHSMARAYEAAGDAEKARQAYGRALTEDLSFHPAHVGLGLLAVQAGDTAAFETELELAVQLRPADPVIRLLYGTALSGIGKLEAARTQLQKATELEPYFAAPHRVLAQVHDKSGDASSAVASYQAFLDRASATDPARAEAVARRTALASGGE